MKYLESICEKVPTMFYHLFININTISYNILQPSLSSWNNVLYSKYNPTVSNVEYLCIQPNMTPPLLWGYFLKMTIGFIPIIFTKLDFYVHFFIDNF